MVDQDDASLSTTTSVKIQTVDAFTRPYDFWYDPYQTYYREAIRLHCAESGLRFNARSMSRVPRLLRPVRRLRDHHFSRLPGTLSTRIVDRVAYTLEGPLQTPSSLFHDAVGQYVATTGSGEQIRMCVDAADYPHLPSEELVAWSDVYFKANFWPSVVYPSNVVPLLNGDPLVLSRISELRSMRNVPKELDVCAVIRIWNDETAEHNLRLLKALVDAKCKRFVLAVVLRGESDHLLRYLRSARIPATTRELKPGDLWRKTASSTLNLIRLGVHYCIPWRVTGSLAMASCLVFDRPPFSVWAKPLLEGVNYLTFGLKVAPGTPVAPQHQYDELPRLIETWLAQPGLIHEIATSNGEYFDLFLKPQRVGAYILEVAEQLPAADLDTR